MWKTDISGERLFMVHAANPRSEDGYKDGQAMIRWMMIDRFPLVVGPPLYRGTTGTGRKLLLYYSLKIYHKRLVLELN